jgi:hypothetical protein
MTFITVDKETNPPVGQLRKLHAMNNAKRTKTYAWSNSIKASDFGGLGFCVSCHTMPTRAISPVGYSVQNGPEKKMTPEKTYLIAAINRLLTQPTSWGTAILDGKEVRFGPSHTVMPLGWAPENSATRQRAFVEKCAAEREPLHHASRDAAYYRLDITPNKQAHVRWEAVRDAMNCVSCHNGKVRGPLHVQPSAFAFKIAVDKSMPADERLALISCLKKEKDELQEEWERLGPWAKKIPCSGP